MGVEYGADVDKYYCSADSGEGIARGTLAAQGSRSARKKTAAADEGERPTRVAVPKMAVFEVGGASRHAITIRPTPPRAPSLSSSSSSLSLSSPCAVTSRRRCLRARALALAA